MNPAEYMELLQLIGDSIGFHAMNAVAILFAYITAIYVGGQKLSRLQLSLVTILYSFFYFLPSATSLQNIERSIRVSASFYERFPDEALIYLGAPVSGELFVINPAMFAYFLAWVASLVFMRDRTHERHLSE